ncbi:MAG: DUF86 domain-containing protein [Candidatus Cloacimonetes bacterium]|nr:DUF86 domain-containing protein [Candidatus Cloacimonadota bacterium]
MSITDKDLSLLIDMYIHSKNIVEFIKNVSFYEFEKNNILRAATERNLEIIGIAAKKISTETQISFPQIAWKDIIGLRNILAHDYGEIKIEKVWITAQKYIPELILELKKIKELDDYT